VQRLYALPSGTLLRRETVSAVRTEWADALAEVGRAQDFAGPFVRVGDREARVFWVSPGGPEVGVQVPAPVRTLADPARLVVLVEPRAKALLRPPSGRVEPAAPTPSP
jgi:hypothetical protein